MRKTIEALIRTTRTGFFSNEREKLKDQTFEELEKSIS